jgi:hypothetical protein
MANAITRVVSAACTLNVSCPEPVWLKCLCGDSASETRGGPAIRTTTQVSPRDLARATRQNNHQTLILMATTWAGGAVERPTITGLTRWVRMASSPSSVCNDCTFSRSIHRRRRLEILVALMAKAS